MNRRKQWLVGFVALIALIDVSGAASVLLTGGGSAAGWPVLAAVGETFYAWWWMILPCSFIACMLAFDMFAASEEQARREGRDGRIGLNDRTAERI